MPPSEQIKKQLIDLHTQNRAALDFIMARKEFTDLVDFMAKGETGAIAFTADMIQILGCYMQSCFTIRMLEKRFETRKDLEEHGDPTKN